MSQKKTKNLKRKLILSALLLAQFTQINEAKAGLGEQETNASTPISGIIADEQNRFNQELYRKIQEAVKQAEGVLGAAKDKNLVVFLGATGAGKSTTINYLSDVKLEGVVDQNNPENFEVKVIPNNNQTTAKIGVIKDESETKIPQLMDVTYNSNTYTLVDLPGFYDTEGEAQQIINGILIKKILDSAKSLKFVFVAEKETITAAKGFLLKEQISKFKKLYKDENEIESQSLFIVTKCPDGFNTSDLSLLAPWTEKERTLNFNKPQQLGPITKTEEKDKILKALEELSKNEFRPAKIDIAKFPGKIDMHLGGLFKAGMKNKFYEEFKSDLDNLSITDLEVRLALYQDNYFSKVMATETTLTLLKDAAPVKYQEILEELEGEKQQTIEQTISAIESKIDAIKTEEARKAEAEKARLAEEDRKKAQIKAEAEENARKTAEANTRAANERARLAEEARKAEKKKRKFWWKHMF